jgi:hypothetical protein
MQGVAKADQQVEQSQDELQSLQQKRVITPERNRPALESLIKAAQSELAYRQARREALREILQFTGGTGAGGADLLTQIEELARSVPAALSGANETLPEQHTTEHTSVRIPASGTRQQASGIWGLVADLFQALPELANELGKAGG